MTESRQCTVCGKKLRASSAFTTCTAHRTPEERRAAWAAAKRKSTGGGVRATDDSVLSRMGFKTEVDEAPPATERKRAKPKLKAKPAPSRAPAGVSAALSPWQGQFRALASALGLDPDSMIEGHCREWVETTRARALAEPPKLLGPGFINTDDFKTQKAEG